MGYGYNPKEAKINTIKIQMESMSSKDKWAVGLLRLRKENDMEYIKKFEYNLEESEKKRKQSKVI